MQIRKLLLSAILFIVSGCAIRPLAPPTADPPSKDVAVPFTLHDNRIVIAVMVNGRGPYSFLFDTGGSRSNTITPEVASELGLKLEPGPMASGAGSGEQLSQVTSVESYAVGDLVARSQEMIVLDLSAIKRAFAFPRLDGVIGFDVLKKAVTCIDFESLTLVFKEGGSDCFTDRVKTVLPLRIDHNSPMIKGAINGHETEFFVDTGDRSAFSLFQKFAKQSGLQKKFDGQPEVISGHGVGGPIPAKIATLEEIRLGSDLKVKNVISRLPLTTGGFFAKSQLGGSVGNEIWRRFQVVLDYSKGEIRLAKNRHFNEPFQFIPPK